MPKGFLLIRKINVLISFIMALLHWLSFIMALLHWLSFIMALFHHGSLSSWLSFIMALFHHGSLSSWLFFIMALFRHGFLSSWLSLIMAFSHHGSLPFLEFGLPDFCGGREQQTDIRIEHCVDLKSVFLNILPFLLCYHQLMNKYMSIYSYANMG